ncbi:MAG: hypothetical protein HN855_09620 [Anaerolineae bacterium]|jgi:TolB protein|nr:hypothetical protein [Anaerolineae bacterium]MBT7071860.1 hypothetical protein [Anaerolineae bacterium]MBT7325406.1 hypothetical protein [Anaerolineae bacterium]
MNSSELEIKDDIPKNKPRKWIYTLLSILVLCCISIFITGIYTIGNRLNFAITGVNRLRIPAPGKIVFEDSKFYDDEADPRDICIMNASGTDFQYLTEDNFNNYRPILSPDGQKIAFLSNRDGGQDLYVMGIDGRNTIHLANISADNTGIKYYEEEPFSWSPDGNKLVVDSSEGLIIISNDGLDKVFLADMPPLSSPKWSPDGMQILFTAEDRSDLFVINSDGSNLQSISWGKGSYRYPEWSPNSEEILLYHQGITIVDRNGRNDRQINTSVYVGDPQPSLSWSPDGTSILFEAAFNKISIVNTDGSNEQTYDIHPFLYSANPVWSPDGKWIILEAYKESYDIGNLLELLIINIKSGKVYSATSFGSHPHWEQ